mmetsp:Transcript_27029/g.72277  ORF Transcript_27029/g.72277 Transcript_27029/m.72277 type:complete len:250 (-) Transcript_27029:471-1220(-)
MPPPQKVVLEDLRLALCGAQGPDHLERVHEALEDLPRKLQHELLAALHRVRLGPRQVREPVDEIEGNVAGGCLSRDDDLAEGLEQGTRWRLTLHEPAEVVVKLAVCEFEGVLLLLRQPVERGERAGAVLEHVAQGDVVVPDLLAAAVAAEPSEGLADHGLQHVQLHDIVDGHEDEDRECPLGVVRPSGLLQKTSLHNEVLQPRPVHVLVEEHALLVVLAELRPLCRDGHLLRLVLVVHAEAEALLAVQV